MKNKGWWMIVLMWTFCFCVGSLVFSVTDLKTNHECTYVFSISKVRLNVIIIKKRYKIVHKLLKRGVNFRGRLWKRNKNKTILFYF